MMRRLAVTLTLAPALLAGCATHRESSGSGTLAELRELSPDVEEARVEHGLDQAMEGYRRFLDETPETEMTPEAMRRLADLQIEKRFGIHPGDAAPREMAAPESAAQPATDAPAAADAAVAAAGADKRETDEAFERRTTAGDTTLADAAAAEMPADALPADADPAGPLEAIALYDRLLAEYPNYEHRDQVLYQKARAYDELGRTEEAMATMELLIDGNPYSEHYDEVQFRRGEYLFTRRNFREAEDAYSAIIGLGERSSYYELALYKLGWTLYKQEFYEEALHRYMALLDYKVSIGYDFDASNAEEDERRVADTYRVISLSISNLGGPDAAREYFATFGNRSYEDRVYGNLGEHYLAKLRYDDAAKSYRTFVDLYPFHRRAPLFSMRVVETFTKGEFPKLVLEAKREFASLYGLKSDYWRHYAPEETPDVLAYLKTNLKDLANHYHAEYQGTEEQADRLAHYREALRWYGDYLESFPADPDTPPINYQLADLLLENEDFGAAATQYERTAYGYEPHDQSAAAGYAAVYAHREHLKVAGEARRQDVRRETVASSIRFTDTFPEHEHAASVLGAATDDMYEMQEYPEAIQTARRLLEFYPDAEQDIRRSAWLVVAHGSFELEEYPAAEHAYGEVLAATPEDDESYAELVDNLAASIYKRGELANEAQDYRAAADRFLRIRTAAPSSTIRATAEYDAGVALMALEDWAAATDVLETFRDDHPEHELHRESTRLIAYAYREDGRLGQAGDEYDRLAAESDDPVIRSEALLVAGDLYEQAGARAKALDVYTRYVDEFPAPIETAVETRYKIAGIREADGDDALYHAELAEIVRIDAEAGAERTGRTRTLAGRSALVLAEQVFDEFVAVRLSQPFEVSLHEKQQRMDRVIEAMGRLVDYEIADVTAAATFYMAETYLDFSRALMDSERPTDLAPAELAEYELVLDEEAFPFEEKAIDVHEENLELMQTGVFNPWTEKSLGKLAELVPGRYAKDEMSAGLLAAIDRYVYVSPVCQVSRPAANTAESAVPEKPVETSRLEPTVDDDGVTDHASPR